MTHPEKKDPAKIKFYILLFIAFLISVLTFYVGHSVGVESATVELNGKKADVGAIAEEIDRLQGKIAAIKGEVAEYETELNSVNEKYSIKSADLAALSGELKEAKALISQKEDFESEITALDGLLEEKKGELSGLEASISEAETKLEKLMNGIKEKEQAPIILPAGVFVVGLDLPAGRYKIESERGNGNYFVNDGRDANLLLGKGDDFWLSEYIMFLDDGDVIEAGMSVRYTGVL